MKLSFRASLVLLGCTLLSPLPLLAFEQNGQAPPPPEPPISQQFPGPNGRANFRQIVSGEFTGDLRRDTAFLDLNKLVFLKSPAIYDSRVVVADPVNDVAVLSGYVPGQDLLVTVGPFGLNAYQHNSPSGWSSIMLSDGDPTWNGATLVRTADVNGDGWNDIVAVLANRRDIKVKFGSASLLTAPGQAATTTWVNPNQTIRQLELMNWTGGSGVQGGVMFSDLGWACRDLNTGAWLAVKSYTLTPMYGAVVDMPSGPDRLVVRTVFGGTDRITINDATRIEGPYNLGALGIVSMKCADMTSPNLDGLIDLILTTNTDNDLRIYAGQNSTTTWDFTATPAKYPFGAPNRNPLWNQSDFTLGDFDNDGKPDVLAPGQGDPSSGSISVYGCITLIRPNPNWVKYTCPITDAAFIDVEDPNLPDQVELTFNGPQYAPYQSGNGLVADFLINLYRIPGVGQPTVMSPFRVWHMDIPATLHTGKWTFNLPTGWSPDTSTDFFAIVAYQRLAQGTNTGPSVAIRPALVGWLVPSAVMHVGGAPDVKSIAWLHRKGEEGVMPSSWDEGPTVPPVPDDNEPEEVTGGG